MPHQIPSHLPLAVHAWEDTHRAPSEASLTVAVLLRPSSPDAFEHDVQRQRRLDLAAFLYRHQPRKEAVQALHSFAAGSGLGLAPVGGDPFLWHLTGSVSAFEKALSLTFRERHSGERAVRYPASEPMLPAGLAPHVTALVGLDTLAVARPLHRRPRRLDMLANGGQGFFPQDIRNVYGVPAGEVGKGSRIGLLEFSSGYDPADLTAFWRHHGISRSLPLFEGVLGGANDASGGPADAEATLDIAWAGAIAPAAQLVVLEAPAGRSDASFAASLVTAFHVAVMRQPPFDAISISYGDGESSFAPASLHAMEQVAKTAALLGVSVLIASGDQGSYGLHEVSLPLAHAGAPADLPHATAVGGTHLETAPDGSRLLERAWSDTNQNGASGGGISQVFPVPSFQAAVKLPSAIDGGVGRGIPDVALNADPDTGYALIVGQMATVIGGTSAAAPIWAAFVALWNGARRSAGNPPLGYLNPGLYALSGNGFYDITKGNNAYFGVPGYDAGPGWDAVTGWGSPLVGALGNLLG